MHEDLLRLFYDAADDLAEFQPVDAAAMPDDYRRLLDHEDHMTVTVEAFYGGPVDVEVVQLVEDDDRYAREIVLTFGSDRRVVQYGIMRIQFGSVPEDVRRQIEARQTPLGRILIEHNVLRRIRRLQLFRVEPHARLCGLLKLDAPRRTFGRTASIDCNGEPAIELLEIVAPVD